MYISESTQHKSYTTFIATKIKDEALSDPDDAWYHFLEDYIFQLRANSTIVIVTPIDMNRYRYRVRDYMVDVLQIDPGMELAFRLINRLPSDLAFNDSVTTVMVPNLQQVKTLKSKYKTVMTNYRKKRS